MVKESDKDVKKKTTKKTNTKKKPTKKVKKESYIKSVKNEMSLVKWPSSNEVAKNTIATVVLCIFICLFFVVLSLALAAVKGWLS